MDDLIKSWSKGIIWKGNEHTNKSSRESYIPKIIVDHIVEGSASSCISWFTSDGNDQSSAHFLVAKNGKVYQFVSIEDKAWANGLKLADVQKAKSETIRSFGVNPNLYSVSIEHEGVYTQTRGQLTPEQFNATCLLHMYIIQYVKDKWGFSIPVSRTNILGHYEIDPIRKPTCPGDLYPFNDIITRIKEGFYLNWSQVLHKVSSNADEWENAINLAVDASTKYQNLGALGIFKYLKPLIEKTYNNLHDGNCLGWKEIIYKVTSNPKEWENAIDVAVNAASAEGDLGALEIFKYLKPLIEKIYNSH